MSRFLLREIPYSNIHVELAEIGFDSLYLDVISEKFRYKNKKYTDYQQLRQIY